MARLPLILVLAGLLGLVISPWLAPPAWAWLALVGGGLVHSLAWRAAGVRRVSGRERRKHERRVKNAEIRERRLLRRTDRIARRMKDVLAEVREHPSMEWGHTIAATVRELQAGQQRHESVLVRNKMLADKTAADLSGLVAGRLADDEE